MVLTVCKLLSVPVLAGSLFSIIVAVQAAIRDSRKSSAPKGAEKLFSNLMLKTENRGRERWVDGKPLKPPLNHLDIARIINAPLMLCLCLAWVWPAISSPASLMAAALLTLACYLIVSGAGSMLAFLLMLRMGWARASGEDGGGGERSLYHPQPPSGSDGIRIPEIWVSQETSRANRS